jgi:murein DD-endopeptidase MepM/ murein hydrolase activator NlpD
MRNGSQAPRTIGICAALLAFIITNAAADAADRELRLPDHLQQGQLVIGHAPHNAKIEYAGRRLRIGEDGVFVFGIERDAPAHIKLHVRYANGKAQDQEFAVAKRDYHIERVDGLPQNTVTPDPETQRRAAADHKRIVEARRRDDAREDFLGGFIMPVEGARIGGVYGSQRIDNGTPMAPHFGLDMIVPTGTPVHAPAAGIVTLAELGMVMNGGIVLIDFGYGLSSATIHLSKIDVKTGDKVTQGQVIGLSGATGRATGPHVHWTFNWFDMPLDPALLPKHAENTTP